MKNKTHKVWCAMVWALRVEGDSDSDSRQRCDPTPQNR